MRRLARRLFTLSSAVSLLLCVAVCGLWVLSYRTTDEAHFTRITVDAQGVTSREWYVFSGFGRVAIRRTHAVTDRPTVVRREVRGER